MSKTAVIFTRVSSESDRQNASRQIHDLKNYALKNEIEVNHIFQEKISGAKELSERTVLNDCIKFCVEKQINILLISEISRLGRSTLNVLTILKELHENNINVFIQNLNLYTLLDNGELNPLASIITTILSEFASIERNSIKERLSSGRAQYIRNGGTLGRTVGSVKKIEVKKEEYKEVISLLKKGISIRNTAKLGDVSISTVQRVKKEFAL